MEKQKIDGFLNLERNLEAMIHEGTVKIGFLEGETINIYYDNDLVLHLLNIENKKDVNILLLLQEFQLFIEKNWGSINIKLEKNRYKFSIPSDGVKYVHEKNKNNTFLKELIEEMANKNCSVDSVLNIFYKFSEEVICEKAENSEFEYIIYFKNKNIDSFKYCFSFDIIGKYYHRLTYYDFDKL